MPARTRANASYANPPSTTTTRTRSSNASSRWRYGRHRSRSSGVGLLSGGAHRTAAATYASCSSSPSSDDTDVAWFAKPSRCNEPKSQSPERSPVKTRPVRFPPCAAGASPAISTRACGSPKPGTGRPQYVSSRNDSALLGGDPLAPLDEPRARAARDDLVGQRAQLVGAGTGHSGIVRVGFGAVRLQLIVNPIASGGHVARTRTDDPIARGRTRRRSHRDRATRRRDQAGA